MICNYRAKIYHVGTLLPVLRLHFLLKVSLDPRLIRVINISCKLATAEVADNDGGGDGKDFFSH